MTVTATRAGMWDQFRQHSAATDPRQHRDLLRRLPREPAALVEIFGPLVSHHVNDVASGAVNPGPERMREVEIRTVPDIIDRLLALDPRPLTASRELPQRLLGTCRQSNLLMVSALRVHGVPSRLRYITCNMRYQRGGMLHDHIAVEYWDADQDRWRYADTRIHQAVRTQYGIPDEHSTDLPAAQFRTGAQTWLRSKESDTAAFQLSGFKLNADAGRWLSRNVFMHDLASLHGWEPQPWDTWGYMRATLPWRAPGGVRQHQLLDHLAQFDAGCPDQWAQLRRAYRDARNVRLSRDLVTYPPQSPPRRVRVDHATWRRCAGD